MRFLVTYSFIINYYAKVTTIFHSIKLNWLIFYFINLLSCPLALYHHCAHKRHHHSHSHRHSGQIILHSHHHSRSAAKGENGGEQARRSELQTIVPAIHHIYHSGVDDIPHHEWDAKSSESPQLVEPHIQPEAADWYAHSRYGSWVNAKRFWLAHNWY